MMVPVACEFARVALVGLERFRVNVLGAVGVGSARMVTLIVWLVLTWGEGQGAAG